MELLKKILTPPILSQTQTSLKVTQAHNFTFSPRKRYSVLLTILKRQLFRKQRSFMIQQLRRLIKTVRKTNPTISSTELKDEVYTRFGSTEPLTDEEVDECKELIAELVGNLNS